MDEKHGGRSGPRRWNGSVNEYVGGEEVEDVVVGAVGVVVAVGGYVSGYDHEEVNGYVTEEVEGDDGSVLYVQDEPKRMLMTLKEIGVQPTEFEHFG